MHERSGDGWKLCPSMMTTSFEMVYSWMSAERWEMTLAELRKSTPFNANLTSTSPGSVGGDKQTIISSDVEVAATTVPSNEHLCNPVRFPDRKLVPRIVSLVPPLLEMYFGDILSINGGFMYVNTVSDKSSKLLNVVNPTVVLV